VDQNWEGNEFLLARANAPKALDGTAFFWSSYLADQHVLHKDAYFIPVRLQRTVAPPARQGDSHQAELLDEARSHVLHVANLSEGARSYLSALAIDRLDDDADAAALIWLHALAIGFSPAYLAENASGVRHGWPHVPLPPTAEALRESAELGRQIASLLDVSLEIPGVTTAAWRPFLRVTAVVTRTAGGSLTGEEECELTRWGYVGQNGIIMPGQGHIESRPYTDEEKSAMGREATALGLSLDDLTSMLGDHTYDVYLNDAAYWKNIPAHVWEFAIGGFPAVKKWLSYRDQAIIGRPLTTDEVREVERMARRIAALTMLQPRLDANYHGVAIASYPWTSSANEKSDDSKEAAD
jgi:hypothetical protein